MLKIDVNKIKIVLLDFDCEREWYNKRSFEDCLKVCWVENLNNNQNSSLEDEFIADSGASFIALINRRRLLIIIIIDV